MGRPPGRSGTLGKGATRLLLLLDRPRHGPELHRLLGVSRQRVHQVLDDLYERGLIRPADPDNPTFAVARRDDSTLLLRSEQERMLSVFPDGTATTLAKIGKAMGRSGREVAGIAESLLDAGLIENMGRTKRRDLYGLTPMGAAHWQRSSTAVRAGVPPPPFRSDRVFNVLSYLAAHGTAYPREISRALQVRLELIYALIDILKRKNVVRNHGSVRRAPYELTEFGRSLLDERTQMRKPAVP
jgi:DNA-binding MarR family transcriptional regulator